MKLLRKIALFAFPLRVRDELAIITIDILIFRFENQHIIRSGFDFRFVHHHLTELTIHVHSGLILIVLT